MTGPAADPPPEGAAAEGAAAPAGAVATGDIDRWVAIALLGVVGIAAWTLFAPILPAMLWAVLLAIVSAGPYERLLRLSGGRSGPALAGIGLLYLLVLVLPVLLCVLQLWAWAPDLARMPERIALVLSDEARPEEFRTSAVEALLLDLVSRLPEGIGARAEQALSGLGGALAWIGGSLAALGGFLFDFLLGCATALAILSARARVLVLSDRILRRVGGGFGREMLRHALLTTSATFAGVLAAALAQTALATLALVLAGTPGLMMLIPLTFLLALLQVGPFVILLVAAGIEIAEGGWLAAGLLAVWFLLVVASADNVIRPWFAARGGEVSAYLTFLGAIGGLFAFGLIGVFVGPVLISLLYRMLLAWLSADAAAAPATAPAADAAGAATPLPAPAGPR